jgi:hypothetical protein
VGVCFSLSSDFFQNVTCFQNWSICKNNAKHRGSVGKKKHVDEMFVKKSGYAKMKGIPAKAFFI